eukprot:jgi/Ulvmu1/11245/UM073_0017.1
MASRLVPAARGVLQSRANSLCSGARQVRASASIAEQINAKNAENPVMVYSKSYCPYCAQVKQLFGQYKVDAKYAELDQIAEGSDIQSELQLISGSRTVPQVFIAGEFIGGCTETMELDSVDGLLPKLKAAGVSYDA